MISAEEARKIRDNFLNNDSTFKHIIYLLESKIIKESEKGRNVVICKFSDGFKLYDVDHNILANYLTDRGYYYDILQDPKTNEFEGIVISW